jgi:ferric-dicitrate binding protein FerR (iron transport regulator)
MAAGPMKRSTESCPDFETIAAFLDGRLDAREREAMAGHLAGCETCYAIFLEAAQIKPANASAVTDDRWWKRRPTMWQAAAGLAAAAVLVIAVRFGIPARTPVDSGLQELVTAVGPERTIEPRLTGGFEYGPVRGAVRAGEPSVNTRCADCRRAD